MLPHGEQFMCQCSERLLQELGARRVGSVELKEIFKRIWHVCNSLCSRNLPEVRQPCLHNFVGQ